MARIMPSLDAHRKDKQRKAEGAGPAGCGEAQVAEQEPDRQHPHHRAEFNGANAQIAQQVADADDAEQQQQRVLREQLKDVDGHRYMILGRASGRSASRLVGETAMDSLVSLVPKLC
jgi:regulator of protease activity HflC (stomatin/prohibitin superfamily)